MCYIVVLLFIQLQNLKLKLVIPVKTLEARIECDIIKGVSGITREHCTGV